MSVCFNPGTFISLPPHSLFYLPARCVFALRFCPFLLLQVGSYTAVLIIFLEKVNPSEGRRGSDAGSEEDGVIPSTEAK